MQKTQLIGYIGKDAEVNEHGNNTVINFNVASTENWKNKEGEKQSKTTWFRCAWWTNNTVIAKYLTKGTQVYVEGKANGSAYIKNETAVFQEGINVYSVELLGGKNTTPPADNSQPSTDTEGEEDLPF